MLSLLFFIKRKDIMAKIGRPRIAEKDKVTFQLVAIHKNDYLKLKKKSKEFEMPMSKMVEQMIGWL